MIRLTGVGKTYEDGTVAVQELDLEVNGLATPILDSAGTTIAVATLYGPSYRFAEQLDPKLGAQFAALVRARTVAVSG